MTCLNPHTPAIDARYVQAVMAFREACTYSMPAWMHGARDHGSLRNIRPEEIMGPTMLAMHCHLHCKAKYYAVVR